MMVNGDGQLCLGGEFTGAKRALGKGDGLAVREAHGASEHVDSRIDSRAEIRMQDRATGDR